MSHQLQRSLGQRVSQTVSSIETEYLLDAQPGLWNVIAADDGTDVNRYIHEPVTGRILQHEDPTGDWNWPALDGLGTVRGVYDDTLAEVYAADRDPYGDLIASTGSNPTPFEYTGEPEDQNGLLYLRARYYDPVLAVFNSLDQMETSNRYAYVDANPINMTDLSGLICVPDGSVNPFGSGGFGLNLPGVGPGTSAGKIASIPSVTPINLSLQLPPTWNCLPNDRCNEWLQAAYEVLQQAGAHGSGYVQSTLRTLEAYRQPGLSSYNMIYFVGIDGGFAPASGHIFLDSSYLNDNIASNDPTFLNHVGVLAHELRHTEQGPLRRASVWGELDAYNRESRLRTDLGLANAGWREELLDIGGDDPLQNGTTENIGALCQARDILIDICSGPGETLYSYEPLVFKRGFIPVTPEACILTDVPEIVTDAGEDVGEAIGEAFNDALCRFSGYNFCR